MKDIEVYSIDNCAYCEAAKNLLAEKKLPYKEINIGKDIDQIRNLVERTGHRTMPQIFIDGLFIGGFTELKITLQNK